MRYVSTRGLNRLLQYKYTAGLASFLDSYIMTPYWNWVVTLLPMWLAPNLITTISLVHAFMTWGLIQYYAPNFYEPAPQWAYGLGVIWMFLYQTLDAVDGKQARRTGSSSPLGQLFDHGCDAICSILSGLFVACCIQGGPTWTTLLVLYMHLVPFFASNWEEFHTGFMRFGVMGITEGQFLVMGVLATSAIFGPQAWFHPIETPIITLQVRHIFVILGLIGITYQSVASVLTVMAFYRKKENKGHYNGPVAIWQMFQFILVLACGGAWLAAPSGIFIQHPVMILLIIGCLFGYQVTRLIICHVTDEPYDKIFKIVMPLPFAVLNSWATTKRGDHLISESTLIHVYFIAILIAYAHYVQSVVQEICSFLKINCFTIKPRPVAVAK